jgi:hypothetical protein
VLADAALSHVLSSYYSPDRGRLPFEYLITLAFLASFRMPLGAPADANTLGNRNGWRGAA